MPHDMKLLLSMPHQRLYAACSCGWRTRVTALGALGLSPDCPTLPRPWRDIIRERLRPFRRAVAAAVSFSVAAE